MKKMKRCEYGTWMIRLIVIFVRSLVLHTLKFSVLLNRSNIIQELSNMSGWLIKFLVKTRMLVPNFFLTHIWVQTLVCPWQAFPAMFNITLKLIRSIRIRLLRKWSVVNRIKTVVQYKWSLLLKNILRGTQTLPVFTKIMKTESSYKSYWKCQACVRT